MNELDPNEPRPEPPPSGDPHAYPPAALSGFLTAAAFLVMIFVLAPLAASGSGVLGLSAGTVLGFGLVGTLTARRVPAPTDQRLGLRPMSTRALGIVLLLAPIVFWLSELDNVAAELSPRPEELTEEQPETGATNGGGLVDPKTLRLLEVALFAVFLRPVVEEFFFRGVVQQGAVAQLGMRSGLLFQTVLYATARSVTGAGSGYAVLSLMSQSVVEGLLLGSLRLGTGSILPGIVLQGLINGVGLLALGFAEEFPIEGLNLQEGHMSPWILLPALLPILLGLRHLRTDIATAPPLPPAPPPQQEEP